MYLTYYHKVKYDIIIKQLSLPLTPWWHTTIIVDTYIQKDVEPVLSLVPRVKAFALPRLSKRATSKAPRWWVYTISPLWPSITTTNWETYINIPWDVPVALFLTICLSLRSSNTSKPKRTVTPFMYNVPHCLSANYGNSAWMQSQRYKFMSKAQNNNNAFLLLSESKLNQQVRTAGW